MHKRYVNVHVLWCEISGKFLDLHSMPSLERVNGSLGIRNFESRFRQKKPFEIWIQWLCCDFAYFWISSLLTSASKNQYANACWHISCIYEGKTQSDKELALAMPVHLRSTIYSFFRTCVNDMSESAFNLRHLGLLRHVKTINFLKTMKITSSQYVFVRERSPRRRSFVCFNFQPLL